MITYKNFGNNTISRDSLIWKDSAISQFLDNIEETYLKISTLANRLQKEYTSSLNEICDRSSGVTYEEYYQSYVKEMETILQEIKAAADVTIKNKKV